GFVIYSDGRFKKNLNEDVPGLAFILQLKPVTYNYDIHGLNKHLGISNAARQENEGAVNAKEKIKYSGFVAQDVEAAAKKINYDFSGLYKPQNEQDAYGLSYEDFVVPLVKSIQELQAENEALKKKLDDLSERFDEQNKTTH
ncbi:MAG: tail fiber domain-containing protein, partial [Ferruginibacter sp.]